MKTTTQTLTGEFARFGVVGTIGFIANVSIVYATAKWIGPYAGGLLAWVGAATITWSLNRIWTFKARQGIMAVHRQWLLFLGANSLGFILYYATYTFLITYSAICATYPVRAVAAGAVVSFVANFMLSRRLVFTRGGAL